MTLNKSKEEEEGRQGSHPIFICFPQFRIGTLGTGLRGRIFHSHILRPQTEAILFGYMINEEKMVIGFFIPNC